MRQILLLLGACITFIVQSWGQVRDNIYSLSASDQSTLTTLIEDYLDEFVIATHAFNTPMVHGNSNFLPFHRAYVEGLEDYLTLRGYPQFVPLQKWDPENQISAVWRSIDPACNSITGGGICDPLVNVTSNSSRALPSSFIGSSLCTYLNQNSLGSALESPWHNNVHSNSIYGVNGAMRQLKSPSAVIFWPWHAYVDDVWKEWECNCQGAPSVDLWMRDTKMKLGLTASTMYTMSMDQGNEPNIESDPNIMWVSEDIWIRNDNTGLNNDQHQNPQYDPNGSPAKVYVRVRNRGCDDYTSGATLHLYWAKASTGVAWPAPWDGSANIGGQPELGNEFTPKPIPEIKANGQVILEFPWPDVPNPDDYPNTLTGLTGSNAKHHFCLLARVVSTSDPMASTETGDVNNNVHNNNNIAQKNITVLDEFGSSFGGGLVGVTDIGLFQPLPDGFITIGFGNAVGGQGILTDEAEIRVYLSDAVWDKWVAGGQSGNNIDVLDEEMRELLLTGNNATLENLEFESGENHAIGIKVNFLTQQSTSQIDFDFDITQFNEIDNSVMGGERFRVIKPGRIQAVIADAGNDKIINDNESTMISANALPESVVYKWYDLHDSLIFEGKDFTVSPEITTKYKLQVVADYDGFTDYDSIQVKVRDCYLTNIYPNPVTTTATFGYKLAGTPSAYLNITRPYSGINNSYMLDPSLSEKNIDLSTLPAGTYTVTLVCNGVPVDSKTFTKL